MTADGIYCLANDGIIDGLIALCQSLRGHSPELPMTVIPFDSQLSRTRQVLAHYGYSLYDDPTLEVMDRVGERYWLGDRQYDHAAGRSPHTMRKFCVFWGEYERFFFLDADVVVLHSLSPYFEAFSRRGADFMYLACDIDNVYRPGATRDELTAMYQCAGFNSGLFMGRAGTFTPDQVEETRQRADRYRHAFVDNGEQTLINFAIDVNGVSQIDAHDAVPDLVAAGASMRLRGRDDHLVLSDARIAESTRRVSILHWAGYNVGPFMPYRRIFLDYRLPHANMVDRLEYRARDASRALERITWKTPVRLLRRARVLAHNSLASRGIIGWP